MTVGTQVAQLNGEVDGDVLAAGEVVDVNGSMGRDISIHAERLNIGPTAEVKGQAKYEGRREAEVSPGAKLASPIVFTYAKRGPNYRQAEYYYHRVWLWGASFLLALAIIFVAPGFFFDVTQACKRVGPAIGFGALFLFATPIAAIIVCLTNRGTQRGHSRAAAVRDCRLRGKNFRGRLARRKACRRQCWHRSGDWPRGARPTDPARHRHDSLYRRPRGMGPGADVGPGRHRAGAAPQDRAARDRSGGRRGIKRQEPMLHTVGGARQAFGSYS